jgi:hypothetical protein
MIFFCLNGCNLGQSFSQNVLENFKKSQHRTRFWFLLRQLRGAQLKFYSVKIFTWKTEANEIFLIDSGNTVSRQRFHSFRSRRSEWSNASLDFSTMYSAAREINCQSSWALSANWLNSLSLFTYLHVNMFLKQRKPSSPWWISSRQQSFRSLQKRRRKARGGQGGRVRGLIFVAF